MMDAITAHCEQRAESVAYTPRTASMRVGRGN